MEAIPLYTRGQLSISKNTECLAKLSKVKGLMLGHSYTSKHNTAMVLKKALTQLPLDQCKNILDLGCGIGENTLMLARAFKNNRVLALDSSHHTTNHLFNEARKMDIGNVDVFTGQVQELPKHMMFDLIFNVDTPEYPDTNLIPFSECHSRLNKDGYLLIRLPNTKQNQVTTTKNQKGAKRELLTPVYDIKTLERRFKQEGFKVLSKVQHDGFCARVAWEIRYSSKKVGSIISFIATPICKAFIYMDKILSKQGNQTTKEIIIVGQKI